MQQIGPYRVEERLGAGGMGEVYKAYDGRLERWVAIKRIRSDKNEAEENRQRFQREARATAKLNHSSIVHLYDIFQDGDIDCIVMEYVEGKTLDQLIRNGPLEPAQAADLGYEIAAGLSEAHAKGIIHRDLKVENIIVTPEGRAKILDFGLARPLLKDDFETSLTGKGQLVGTSRTMSPEYVSGEDIDHRSDLFSLGVLLYEAVTSHSPFRAHNTLATLKQVMLHRQTPAHHVNGHVPEGLSDVIENLLEKDPADRPQSAQEVAQEFRRISGQLSSGDIDRPMSSSTFTTSPTEVFAPSATSVDLWARRRWLTVAGALLIVGIAATYSLTRWSLDTDSSRAPTERSPSGLNSEERDRIVLADFQNHTGEPLLDDSLAIAFRTGLEQSRHASILPQSQVRSTLARMVQDPNTPVTRDLAVEIGQREGARAVVIGAIVKIGETYSLSAEVVAPQSGANSFSTDETAKSQNEIVTALEKLTKSIRLNLGESVAAIENGQDQNPLEKVTTRNLEALKAYSLGIAEFGDLQYGAAIPFFERALELDHEFAMAHAKLVAIYSRLDLDQAKTHLEKALLSADRLTEIEKLYLQGWAARLNGDPETVVNVWSLMSTLYPSEFSGQMNLGLARWYYFVQFAEAARAFENAAKVATEDTRSLALTLLGYCQLALGQDGQALASFEQSSSVDRKTALVDVHLHRKSYATAETLAKEYIAEVSRPSQAEGFSRLTQIYLGSGRFEEGREQALEARELAESQGEMISVLDSQFAVMTVQSLLADTNRLRRDLDKVSILALDLASARYEQFDAAPVDMVAFVGKLNARNGNIENAEAILEKVSNLAQQTPVAVWRGAAAMLDGEILLAQGKTDESIARFREALALANAFQTHESLARAFESKNLSTEAIGEYEWLINNRGQGIVECLNKCHGVNLVTWSLALYRLARLHEESGDLDLARRFYREFVEHWPNAEKVDVWQIAKRRELALQQ